MNRIMRIKTVMVIKTKHGNSKLDLQTQANIDIGAILDILDSVSCMEPEQSYIRIN